MVTSKGERQHEEDPVDQLPVNPDGADDGELVPEDDRVIGTAFRYSLGVMLVIALAIGTILYVRGRQQTPEATLVRQQEAPQQIRQAAEPPSVPFSDITAEAGIDYVHFDGRTGEKLLPETMGGGGGFVDVDGDMLPDIVLIGGAPWAHGDATEHPPSVVVYRNLGAGRFEDATSRLGLGETSFYGMGLAAADYDGDGHVDLFVTAVGRNRLFRNTGTGFVEVTDEAGVGGGDDEWSTGAAFFDVDGDGDLDLFVCNYVRWSREIDLKLDYRLTGVGRAYGPPLNYEGTFPYLYRNDGGGRFTDVSAESGVQVRNPATDQPVAKSLAVAVLDLDEDGASDLMVANDTVQNFLFRNLGEGRFEEVGEYIGLAYDRQGNATGAMGLDAGAFRNSDDLGFVIGNFSNEMTSLYVSQGDRSIYADEAIPEGIGNWTRTALTFGVLFFDVDLDGWLDLLQNNGHLEEDIAVVDPSQTYLQAPQLFWNTAGDSTSSFVPVPTEVVGDLAEPIAGRGSAYADIDADGDLDLLLLQVGGKPHLLRNDQDTGHHWLRLILRGPAGNRDAIGAEVELKAGGTRQTRTVSPARSYLSQVEGALTFGLGDAEVIDSLVVRWPDGSTEEVTGLEIDQQHVLEQ